MCTFILTDLPVIRGPADTVSIDEPENISDCRDSFIKWLTTFTISPKKPEGEVIK